MAAAIEAEGSRWREHARGLRVREEAVRAFFSEVLGPESPLKESPFLTRAPELLRTAAAVSRAAEEDAAKITAFLERCRGRAGGAGAEGGHILGAEISPETDTLVDEATGRAFTAFVVRVRTSLEDELVVKRRFRDFDQLHAKLLPLGVLQTDATLPTKVVLQRRSSRTIKQRVKHLNDYLEHLVSVCRRAASGARDAPTVEAAELIAEFLSGKGGPGSQGSHEDGGPSNTLAGEEVSLDGGDL